MRIRRAGTELHGFDGGSVRVRVRGSRGAWGVTRARKAGGVERVTCEAGHATLETAYGQNPVCMKHG